MILRKIFRKNYRKKAVHFLHVSKTGGSVLKATLHNNLDHSVYSIQFHGHKIKLTDIPKGQKFFFFLRDPLSKFVSAFYSRQRMGKPRYNAPWNKLEENMFSVFNTPNELAVALGNRSSIYHSLAKESMTATQHFARYYERFQDLEYFKSRLEDLLFIGFQETLDEDFEELKKTLCLPRRLSLSPDNVIAHKNPPGLDKSLENASIAALSDWYAGDIELVSFCRALKASRGNKDFL